MADFSESSFRRAAMPANAKARLVYATTRSISMQSVQTLYDLAQKEGLFSGVDREVFDRLPFLLLWAAIDPDSYTRWAHMMFDRAGVPSEYRQFDHNATMGLLRKNIEAIQPARIYEEE